jgi:hypothetical protein
MEIITIFRHPHYYHSINDFSPMTRSYTSDFNNFSCGLTADLPGYFTLLKRVAPSKKTVWLRSPKG